jgi:hypothetical protein
MSWKEIEGRMGGDGRGLEMQFWISVSFSEVSEGGQWACEYEPDKFTKGVL